MKRKYGHITYNKYCNFTNYGSALHTFALQKILNNISPNEVESVVIDYCPKSLEGVNVLEPYARLWDSDEETKEMIRRSMPAIELNKKKFDLFYEKYVKFTERKYTSDNIEECLVNEDLYGYVCGSDTIWCLSEFGGFDKGFFADCDVMKNANVISYAASFGDDEYSKNDLELLTEKLGRFSSIGVRETTNLKFIKEVLSNKHVMRTIDPTLLLTRSEYDEISCGKEYERPYVLLYARRSNKYMEEYADRIAEELGCQVIEISLRAINSGKHIMRYDAGVEEFLFLVKNAKYVVTNSFHGVIFSIIYHVQFDVFTREQADVKIRDLLSFLSITDERINPKMNNTNKAICYEKVDEIIQRERTNSIIFLREALQIVE